MKSELPNKEDLVLNMFYVNPTDKDKEVIINDIGFSFDQILKVMEEYGRQCIAKALEIAAEEAKTKEACSDRDWGDSTIIVIDKQSILKLINDPRLKP